MREVKERLGKQDAPRFAQYCMVFSTAARSQKLKLPSMVKKVQGKHAIHPRVVSLVVPLEQSRS